MFLIGLELKSGESWQFRESLEELGELAATAGGALIGTGTQKLETPVAGTFIGTGKAEEFARFCRENDVDTVVFDDELSPAQKPRNLEKIFGCKGAGSNRADPRYFCAARPHARGQVAGGTSPIAAFAAAAYAVLGTPFETERRHRNARRRR